LAGRRATPQSGTHDLSGSGIRGSRNRTPRHARDSRSFAQLVVRLAALREGDYSIRARGAGAANGLALALLEVNMLSDTLPAQRLRALEATALLRRVIEEIDVAVFAFDAGRRLRLVNRAANGCWASARTRSAWPAASPGRCRVLEAAFHGGAGRWDVRGTSFRQDGLPHQLLALSDLSPVLRAEERSA
jgi:hypothetical protein